MFRNALISLTLLLSAGAANAPPTPPVAVRDALPELALSGSGEYSVLWMDIYQAALWAPNGRYEPDKPFALSLRYAREIDGKDIAQRSVQEMRDLGVTASRLQAWGGAMRHLFPDVKPGDELTGVMHASGTTQFWLNDQALGEIHDPAFGKAFFGIWLDRRTNAPDLRRELLAIPQG